MESAAVRAGVGLSVIYEIDDLQLMKDIVESGAAHTVLSSLALLRETTDGRLVARRLVEPAVSTSLVIASAANKPVTTAVRAVEQTLKELLRKQALPGAP